MREGASAASVDDGQEGLRVSNHHPLAAGLENALLFEPADDPAHRIQGRARHLCNVFARQR